MEGTAMPSKQVKERVAQLIRIFVDDTISDDRDAGWHQGSMLQQLIDHKGELPLGGGKGSGHEDKMLREIRFVRGRHPLLPDAKRMMASLAPFQRLAVYMYERYGKVPNPQTQRPFTERDIAAMVGMTEGAFHSHRSRAMKALYTAFENHHTVT